jgi:hypothetical protein
MVTGSFAMMLAVVLFPALDRPGVSDKIIKNMNAFIRVTGLIKKTVK